MDWEHGERIIFNLESGEVGQSSNIPGDRDEIVVGERDGPKCCQIRHPAKKPSRKNNTFWGKECELPWRDISELVFGEVEAGQFGQERK